MSDTLTLSSSNHTVKLGGDVQRYHFDGFSYSRFGGEFRFTNLQNFLRASVNRFTGNMPNTDTQRQMRQSYFAFFGQDEWKPADNFTMNYGVRYEFFTVPYDVSEAHTLEWRFDTHNASLNTGEGVWLDDVVITYDCDAVGGGTL